MTFDDWFEIHKNKCVELNGDIGVMAAISYAAWNAATKAERERCREIVDERGRYADIAGMLEQIGE